MDQLKITSLKGSISGSISASHSLEDSKQNPQWTMAIVDLKEKTSFYSDTLANNTLEVKCQIFGRREMSQSGSDKKTYKTETILELIVVQSKF